MKCGYKFCDLDVMNRYDMAYHMQTLHPVRCDLCEDTGYFKSNTAEFEGPCPNGCCSECGKPINSEWHIGKECFSGPWESED